MFDINYDVGGRTSVMRRISLARKVQVVPALLLYTTDRPHPMTWRTGQTRLPRSSKKVFSLCPVGNATNRVSCFLNGREVAASADTGAEIALMSGAFAAKHGLLQEYSCEVLELADGSLEYTSGFADVKLAIRVPGSYGKTTKTVRIHVLKNLQFDVLLDEDIVNDFNIFRNGLSLISSATSELASLAPIVWLGSAERKVAKAAESMKKSVSSIFSTKQEQGEPDPAKPGK